MLLSSDNAYFVEIIEGYWSEYSGGDYTELDSVTRERIGPFDTEALAVAEAQEIFSALPKLDDTEPRPGETIVETAVFVRRERWDDDERDWLCADSSVWNASRDTRREARSD